MRLITFCLMMLGLVGLPMKAQASVTVNVNGSTYTIPQTNEKGWGSNVTSWIQAISGATLYPVGGAFTLLNDVDFGSSYGLKTAYVKSKSSNISTLGVFRLANTDSIGWRNIGNGGNLLLTPNASTDGVLTYNGVDLVGTSLSQTLTNKTISGASNTLSNIGYSSLNLSNSIVNADISTSAAIARSKVASGTASHVVINDGSGNLSSEAQLATSRGGTGQNLSASTGIVAVASGTVSARTIVDADVNASAAIARSKVASGTASHVVINDGSGVLSSEAQLAITRGGTGQSTATAAFDALAPTTTKGDVIARSSSNNVRVAVGSDGQVLTADSASTAGVKWATPSSAPTQADYTTNLGFSAAISANTLVVSLKQADGSTNCSSGASACTASFRGTTATNGNYDVVSFTAANTITLAAADSIGFTASVAGQMFVYLVSDTTSEICLSYTLFDDRVLQSATALTGGADTSASTLYCTSAHTSKPIKLIGTINATWSNPNWGSITNAALTSRYRITGSISSNSTSVERIERARIAITGASACSINSQSGNWINNVSIGSSLCQLNFNTGIWSSAPTCVCSPKGDSDVKCRVNSAPTTSNVAVDVTNNAGSRTNDSDIQVICMGPR